MPLDLLVVERVVASEHVGAAELVAGYSAGHSGADVAVAGVAELQLVVVAVAAGERELELELVPVPVPVPVPVLVPVPVPVLELVLELELVVLEPIGPVAVPVIGFVVAVGGRVG